MTPAPRLPELPGRAAFFWGLFGSMLPEVLRLYRVASSGQPQPDFHWFYFSMSAIFVVSGGIFTVAWKPENPHKAMWVGASFPLLASAMIQSAPTLH